MSNRFQRYELRTTDLARAERFYTSVFGPEFWQASLSVSVLPEMALARGARPHWLGHLGVADPLSVAARLRERGADQLGPTRSDERGLPYVVFREPSGALLSVESERGGGTPEPVLWHVLNATDHERAAALYIEFFDWNFGAEVVIPNTPGAVGRPFAWGDAARSAGMVTNQADGTRIHQHWLFFFPVRDLNAKLAAIRDHGGLALEPVRTPAGELVAAADDDLGAAFGLYEHAAPL